MEEVKQQLFRDVWPELRASCWLEASVASFLDYLRTKAQLVRFSDNWHHLAAQNRDVLFEQIGAALSAAPDGYDIVLGYCLQRDTLRWLHEKYTNAERVHEATLRAVDKALRHGNVPPLPKFYIQRHDMKWRIVINELTKKILKMSPTSYALVNVYGMDGTGKTSLIAACLRDADILRRANYKVYWIDLKHATAGDLLDRMYKLYHKLQIDDPALADLPHDNPGNIGLMKERLLSLFTRAAYARAIVVLDNASAPLAAAIDYFGACNLVAISQERLDLDGRVCYEHLQDAFTYQETMEVFRMALEGDVAPNAHLDAVVEWCRGDLTTTVLCANLMVERRASLLHRENGARAWRRFKEGLCKKDSKVITKRHTTIEMRLQTLDDHLRAKYLLLAVFDTDVNITAPVLSLLWNCEVGDVDDVMLQLCNKSFAVREYNEHSDSYVYGVNHIYLNYLKATNERLAPTHLALITAYRTKYTYYHNFLDDNYIYQYIGYHLYHAGLVEDFSIYRDLKFIEAKIRATGIADVLRDFELYYEHIARQDETLERVVRDLCEFIERFGQNLEKYRHTSILQSALQLPFNNSVRHMALQELKCTGQFGLYFEWLQPKGNKHYIHQLAVKQNLEVACFTHGNPNCLLIGTADGVVQLWDQKYDKVLQEFKGHTAKITYLRALDNTFLSISQDGSVKVWKLGNQSRRNSFALNVCGDSGELSVPSPACIKQKNYQTFFGTNFSVGNCLTYVAVGDSIISADFTHDLLVAGTAQGKLLLWQDESQVFEKDFEEPIMFVQFSNNCSYIYIARRLDVLVYDTSTHGFISKACYKEEILSLHTMQCDTRDEFIVVQRNQVLSCSIMLVKGQTGQSVGIDQQIIMTNEAANTCSSMTDKYLVIGSSDNRIHMWDLQLKSVITEFDTQYGRVVCIDVTTNLDDHSVEILLTSFEDKSVKLWHINPAENSMHQSETVDAFAACWQPECGEFATAIVRKNKLHVVERNETREVEAAEVIVKVVYFGNSVVYALKSGKVFLYHRGDVREIMHLNGDVTYLKAVDDVILAATPRGSLFAYCRGAAHRLRGECRPDLVDFVDNVRCNFKLKNFKKLVVVSQRKISYWNYKFDTEVVLYVAENGNLSCACLSPEGKLCVTFDSTFKVITFHPDVLKIEECVARKTQSVLTSCCFSADGKYLALGRLDGDIDVFLAECLTLSSILKLHESPVHFLKFSHEAPILLSLAEHMAWWNVRLAATQFAQQSARRSFRSRSNSGRSPGKKPPPLTSQLADLDLGDVVMLSKRGRLDKEHLLAAIKLHGQRASHVACANGFRACYSIDDAGTRYNMRMLDEAKMALMPLSPYVDDAC